MVVYLNFINASEEPFREQIVPNWTKKHLVGCVLSTTVQKQLVSKQIKLFQGSFWISG